MIRRFVRRLLDDRKPPPPRPPPSREPVAPVVSGDEDTLLVGDVIAAMSAYRIADIRHPRDYAMGIIPGAVRAPRGDRLPTGQPFVLIDQIGAEAPEIAARLGARWIQGGFAAWLEEGAPIEPPPRAGRLQVGDPARLRGRDGWIQDFHAENGALHATVWFEDGSAVERVPEETLDA
jgi:rhodanese-related sulfurtransferase